MPLKFTKYKLKHNLEIVDKTGHPVEGKLIRDMSVSGIFLPDLRTVLGDIKKSLSKTRTFPNVYTKIESMYSLEVNEKKI